MITMNADTDYVHTHVVNFEPTYNVLVDVCRRWADDETNARAEYRDELRDAVWSAALDDPEHFGLDLAEITEDVDFGIMIEWELENA